MKQLKLAILGIGAALLLPLAFAMPVFAEQNVGSTTDRLSGISNNNSFYVYVKKGEKLKYTFSILRNNASSSATSIKASGPNGEAYDDTFAPAAPVGTRLVRESQQASEDAVWRIDVKSPNWNPLLSWDIAPQSATGGVVQGRVWTDAPYHLAQSKAIDFSLWHINNDGYRYKTTFRNYQGYGSILRANVSGVTNGKDCVPLYHSVHTIGVNNLQNEPTGRPGDTPCNTRLMYIFFAEPSADLPETAKAWDGSNMTIIPKLKPTDINNLQFEHDGQPGGVVGDVKFDIANYDSTARILVDVDNNGSFTDAVDRQILHPVAKQGAQTIAFDGKDGNGADIKVGATLRFKVVADRKGEIHFVSGDVEHRGGGIEVERLNGSDADRSLIFFDDSKLNQTRCGTHTTPVASGPNGISSRGGVHGWTETGGVPCSYTNGNYATNPWGDNRSIDDWTYDTGVVDESVVFVAKPQLGVTKEFDSPAYKTDDEVEYRITLTNDGAVPSSGDITLVDVVPAELEITELPAGCTLKDGKITCAIMETVFVGTPLTLTFKAKALTPGNTVGGGVTIAGGGDSGCADPQNLAARCKATATTVINPIVIPALPLTPGKKKPTPAPAPVPATPAAPALADTGENNVLFTTMAGLATVAGVALLVMKRRVR